MPRTQLEGSVRHVDAVCNFAFRRTASWSVAEDAVQATFSTLWRRARGGGLPPLRLSSARPLLLTMAGHECANLLRSQRRRARLLRRLHPSPDAADHAPQVAERVDDELQMSEVRRAMRTLPPSQREAIELVVWSQLSVAEAAEALGVAEGTVKSRLSRGRSAWRRCSGPRSKRGRKHERNQSTSTGASAPEGSA
jgi:RNA polymerase sigma-70 factor, ECF subfamily